MTSRSYRQTAELRLELAKVIASELGDDFDQALADKSEWIRQRGGEPFRDVNMPFKHDYLAAADRAIAFVDQRQDA
jgi:hypothetical protein